jgi:hypothetical protein
MIGSNNPATGVDRQTVRGQPFRQDRTKNCEKMTKTLPKTDETDSASRRVREWHCCQGCVAKFFEIRDNAQFLAIEKSDA